MAGRKRPIRKYHPPTQDQEDLESLLIFGYECKLFRDDEKAVYVDEGHHLIPWMGDTSLLIDRYDGRGHLYDLHEYDSANVKSQELGEEEKRIEDLCDEERYLELHTDLAEKAMYEEEELKRLNQAFNECGQHYGAYEAVGFNYSYGEPEEEEQQEQKYDGQDEEEDEPFIVTPNLLMPEGMVAPVTEKMFIIIEKTAKFVSKQGTQMEIIIKIKQADNPQFAFLEHQDPLNLFYKHLVSLMKTGKYKHRDEKERRKSAESHEYLHPKLLKLMREEPEPEPDRKDFLESVQSKLPSGQITNTVYAKLVTKMKASDSGRNSPVALPRPVPPPILEKPAAAAAAGSSYSEEMAIGPMPYPMMAAAAYPEHTDSSSSLYGPAPMNLPPPPGMEPVTLPTASTSNTPPSTSSSIQQPPPPGTVPPDTDPDHMMDDNVEHDTDILPRDYMDAEVPLSVPLPALDMQQIIDKMAAYVAKNGPDFEHIVKNKNDERFHFLESWHHHNKYYEYRKKIYLEEMATKNVKVTITQTTQNAVGDTVVTKTTTTLANMQPGKGVSFSIKAKENESSALTNRKIMLYDSSDEEEGNSTVKKEAEDSADSRGSESFVVDRSQEKAKTEKAPVDPEELERRQAEERLKDKISQAAREKVASASREKQLQAERKRRAAMFINMLKSSDTPAPKSASSSNSNSAAGSTASNRDENSKEAGGLSRASSNCSTPPRVSPSNSRTPSPVIVVQSRSNSANKSPSRTRSPSRSDRDWDRPRQRDRDRDIDRRQRRSQWSPRRSGSPPWRRRSPSPRRRRHRSKTPPTAYSVVRTTKSPKKRSRSRSRSQSKSKKKKSRKSRSRSKERGGNKSSKSSPTKSKKSRKSKSRSKSPSRKHKSKDSRRSKSRSRSPSSKKSKKSKHRSKSPSSKSRGWSTSRDSPLVSRKTLATIDEVRTPKPSSSDSRPILPPSTPPGASYRDDDVIIISPDKEEPPSPTPGTPSSSRGLSEATPTSGTPSHSKAENTPTPGTPSSSRGGQSDAPVSKDLLNKVRAMLKATRQQIIKEDGILMD